MLVAFGKLRRCLMLPGWPQWKPFFRGLDIERCKGHELGLNMFDLSICIVSTWMFLVFGLHTHRVSKVSGITAARAASAEEPTGGLAVRRAFSRSKHVEKEPLVASLFLVAMPGAPSSFLFIQVLNYLKRRMSTSVAKSVSNQSAASQVQVAPQQVLASS